LTVLGSAYDLSPLADHDERRKGGYVYRVLNRANARMKIFASDQDYEDRFDLRGL
jgi:hypothetical protein